MVLPAAAVKLHNNMRLTAWIIYAHYHVVARLRLYTPPSFKYLHILKERRCSFALHCRCKEETCFADKNAVRKCCKAITDITATKHLKTKCEKKNCK